MQTVPFYDVTTKKVINIPAAELAPGAVQVQLQGRPGLVWMLVDQIKEGSHRHPPFTGELKRKIQRIHKSLSEHSSMTYEDWEDGLRRDANPESEIGVLLHCVGVYERFAKSSKTADERKEIYKVVMTCSTTTAEGIWNILKVNVLTREQADLIISKFYSRS